MSEGQRNFVVGLTTIAGLVGLAALLMIFGWMPAFLDRGYRVSVELPRAAGLHEGSRVRFAGIDVGMVESVTLQQPPKVGVLVKLQIEPDVSIPATAKATVAVPILGGGSAVEFSVQDRPAGDGELQTLPKDGSALVQGELPDIVSDITRELRAGIAEPVAQLERVTTSFEQLSAEWTEVGTNVNRLLESRGVEMVDAGDAVGNLATVLARVDSRLAEMKSVIAGVERYVNDEELHGDIKTSVKNVRTATDSVAQNIDELTKKYVAVADDLSATIGEMRTAIAKASEGDGTLGRMLVDPALYNNLNDAAQRLQRAIDEIRLLAQKWKEEGLPVQF